MSGIAPSASPTNSYSSASSGVKFERFPSAAKGPELDAAAKVKELREVVPARLKLLLISPPHRCVLNQTPRLDGFRDWKSKFDDEEMKVVIDQWRVRNFDANGISKKKQVAADSLLGLLWFLDGATNIQAESPQIDDILFRFRKKQHQAAGFAIPHQQAALVADQPGKLLPDVLIEDLYSYALFSMAELHEAVRHYSNQLPIQTPDFGIDMITGETELHTLVRVAPPVDLLQLEKKAGDLISKLSAIPSWCDARHRTPRAVFEDRDDISQDTEADREAYKRVVELLKSTEGQGSGVNSEYASRKHSKTFSSATDSTWGPARDFMNPQQEKDVEFICKHMYGHSRMVRDSFIHEMAANSFVKNPADYHGWMEKDGWKLLQVMKEVEGEYAKANAKDCEDTEGMYYDGDFNGVQRCLRNQIFEHLKDMRVKEVLAAGVGVTTEDERLQNREKAYQACGVLEFLKQFPNLAVDMRVAIVLGRKSVHKYSFLETHMYVFAENLAAIKDDSSENTWWWQDNGETGDILKHFGVQDHEELVDPETGAGTVDISGATRRTPLDWARILWALQPNNVARAEIFEILDAEKKEWGNTDWHSAAESEDGAVIEGV